MTLLKIKSVQRQCLATLAVEGIEPSEEAIKINRKFLEGKISSKEAIQMIKNKYLGRVIR